ncbi:hypothetical protein GOODEAATRI_000516 [Goodea atripinnis]|uniref:Uncharacterized protein n=1 Tax=Goodea atripinnis TaxID=208336 RepID=A0ABV0MXL7_9TELE
MKAQAPGSCRAGERIQDPEHVGSHVEPNHPSPVPNCFKPTSYPLHRSSVSVGVLTGRFLSMRPTGNGSRDLVCLESANVPPRLPPSLSCKKRSAEGPPLTPVRAVTHAATASVLTSSWLKFPPRPTALLPPIPPPSLAPYFITVFYLFKLFL